MWAHMLTTIVLYFKSQRKFGGETELNCQTWWCISQSSGLECSQASKFGKAFSVSWYTAKPGTSTTDSTKTNSCQHYTKKTFFVYLKFKIWHVHPTQISELWNSPMSAVSCPDLNWYKPSRILNQPKVTKAIW